MNGPTRTFKVTITEAELNRFRSNLQGNFPEDTHIKDYTPEELFKQYFLQETLHQVIDSRSNVKIETLLPITLHEGKRGTNSYLNLFLHLQMLEGEIIQWRQYNEPRYSMLPSIKLLKKHSIDIIKSHVEELIPELIEHDLYDPEAGFTNIVSKQDVMTSNNESTDWLFVLKINHTLIEDQLKRILKDEADAASIPKQ